MRLLRKQHNNFLFRRSKNYIRDANTIRDIERFVFDSYEPSRETISVDTYHVRLLMHGISSNLYIGRPEEPPGLIRREFEGVADEPPGEP